MALSVDALTALLADLESDRVERKAGLFDKDMVGKIICAFANDLAGHAAPGVLFIGVTDDGNHADGERNDDTGLPHSNFTSSPLPWQRRLQRSSPFVRFARTCC